jgi:hypothetical protein
MLIPGIFVFGSQPAAKSTTVRASKTHKIRLENIFIFIPPNIPENAEIRRAEKFKYANLRILRKSAARQDQSGSTAFSRLLPPQGFIHANLHNAPGLKPQIPFNRP